MSILYIGSNEVCLTNDGLSKVIYSSDIEHINYTKLVRLIEKEKKVTIFIKSFFSFVEHKTFALGMSKNEIQLNIDKRLVQNDVVCASYNHIFAKGKGAEHSNDVIMTIIKDTEQEKHIKTIINELLKLDLDLSRIYSFDQAINTIGMSYSVLNRHININVIFIENSAMIMVSNTTHYLFGRLIKKREDEELITTTANMLATTIKYISTTYSFLHNEIRITIMSQKAVDINTIKTVDSVFDGIKITTQTLKMPNIKIEKNVPTIVEELKLIKLSMDNLKKVNVLTSNALSNHVHAHKFIIILKMVSLLCVSFVITYGIVKFVTGTKLSTDDKQIDLQYDAVVQNTKWEEKKLAKLDKNVYAILATEVNKNIANNKHIEIIKDVSKVFEKHRKLIIIEGYKFSCTECTTNTRKNTLNIDFALFNVNASARFAIKKLNELEEDLRNMLKLKYSNVDIVYKQLSKEKRIASTKDVRDTMVITFSNDK